MRKLCVDSSLRRKSLPVRMDRGADVLGLVQEMWKFVETNPCSGLSAIQLGVPKRICLSLVPPALVGKVHIVGSLPSLVPGEMDHFGVFINPQIVVMDSELVGIEVETCVSMPGVKCIVPRAIDVGIRYQTLHSPRTNTASLNGFSPECSSTKLIIWTGY
ncbi:hypothetical protein BASA82_000156 [Batrachochytrium salamandrivorans]|nr:hypothetical protein BASA82_000156 [Batrachochytrium salamandrivorans]